MYKGNFAMIKSDSISALRVNTLRTIVVLEMFCTV